MELKKYKALFKLGKKPENFINYMRSSDARLCYHQNGGFLNKMNKRKNVINDFYPKNLTFEQFLYHFNIKII